MAAPGNGAEDDKMNKFINKGKVLMWFKMFRLLNNLMRCSATPTLLLLERSSRAGEGYAGGIRVVPEVIHRCIGCADDHKVVH